MKLLTVKAEDADYASWKKAAVEAGMDLSGWIRELANAARDGKNLRGASSYGVAERRVSAPERVAEAKPKSKRTELAEAVAGRTGHRVGCDCFQCVQSERFFKAMRKEE
jgi:hypothetical protein